MEEMKHVYAKILNQYNSKDQLTFGCYSKNMGKIMR